MARYQYGDDEAIVPRQVEAAAATSPVLTSTTIVGVGVGIGSLLIMGFIILGLFFVRKRNAHKREMAELEHGAPVSATLRRDMRQIARPVSAASCNRFTQGGWDQLGSNATVQLPLHTYGKRKRSSVSLPKRIKHKSAIALKPWTKKHLSVIAESPKNTTIPRESSLPIFEALNTTSPPGKGTNTAQSPTPAVVSLPAPGSPNFNVLPSFAIRSPGRYGSGIANGSPEKPKLTLVTRSVSMGVLTDDGAVFGDDLQRLPNVSKRRRPQMHARSVSLGAPSSRPPSGPVPPLPVISPTGTLSKEERLRQVVCISRMSSSSSDSASSSVLVVSPILERRDVEQPLQSPTVEELIKDNDNADLRTVANRQWRNTRSSGPRPNSSMRVEKSRTSVRAKIVRFSTDSALTQHRRNDSSSSTGSLNADENRLSIPRICSAEAASLSRVSSTNSLLGPGSVTKIITPARRISSSNSLLGSGSTSMEGTPTRRAKRVTSMSSVSFYGSPFERRRTSVLREVSDNAGPSKDNTPTRQPSGSTLISRSSSNGNPFHWDAGSPSSTRVTKQSALKGSPNARKGHRRQNCVRISTLTPQVLGPPVSQRCSRSVSPATLLRSVLEECESDEIQRPHTKPVITPTEERQSFLLACGSRAPNTNNLRVQTLRASLTPSSPTLSTWTAYQQEHLERPLPPTRQSYNDSIETCSPTTQRRAWRMSGESFHIPRFPSPDSKSRASISPIQCDTAPMPEFVGISPVDTLSPLDNISPTDFRPSRQNSSLFALHMSSEEPTPVEEVRIPSSSPMPMSKAVEYDPASPHVVDLPPLSQRLTGGEEYDPASPPFKTRREQESEQVCRSSLFLPFAMGSLDLMDDRILSQSPAEENIDSPSCSPKTVPRPRFDTLINAEQPAIPDKNPKRATKNLTSENASAVMASHSINFPGSNVPILLPPKLANDDDDYCPLPRWEHDTSYEDITLDDDEKDRDPTPRPTLARPPSLSTIVQESSSPPPAPQALHNNSSAKAPRERITSPLGPRAPPAKSVPWNVTELRRMNSEVKVHRSRESRNYTRLGREASPLRPWVEADAGDRIHREESSNSLFDFDFDFTHAGAEQQAGDALDEIDFAALSINIEGALVGFNEDYRYSQALKSSPPPHDIRRRGSDKENEQHEREQENRRSRVWDDGEKYWRQQHQQQDFDSRPTTAGSGGSVPLHYIVSSPTSAARSSYYPDVEEKTMDPRLLTTPMGKAGDRCSVVAATPKSLYDADGFLRT